MLKFLLLVAMFMVQMAFAQQRVAVLNTEDDGEPPLKPNELSVLTDKLRDIALEMLPEDKFDVMTTQSIQSFLGSQEEVEKVCKNANGCLAKIGQSIEADFVGQARINRFGKFFTIKIEIYDVKKGTLVGSFTDQSSKDIYALLAVIGKRAPDIFKKMINTSAKPASTDPNVLSDSRDGKKYKAVKIGTQVWMAENLNFNATGSACYDNKPANCDKYGRLYNWNTAKSSCPNGWHLPTKAEWEVMTKYIGGEKTEGKYLKAKSGWNDYEGKSGNGIDKFGFAALPGGTGYSDGDFGNVGNRGFWWSATEYDASSAYFRGMSYDYEGADWVNYYKTYLQSVRCVQD